jgi:hypothetical protein
MGAVVSLGRNLPFDHPYELPSLSGEGLKEATPE